MREDLKDLTIVFPTYIDSEDRLSNLRVVLDYIRHHFDTNIIISEMDTESKLGDLDLTGVQHIFTPYTKMFRKHISVNIGVRAVKTKVFSLYDCDIILHPKQISKSTELILDDTFDVVYPYDGRFYDVPKSHHAELSDTNSTDWIKLEDCELFNPHSCGGAVFFNTDVFWEGGGGNEHFIGVGYEDDEIWNRYRNLGFRVARLERQLYHLNHDRKETSWNHNPNTEHNRVLVDKLFKMSPDQLREEIKTWPWLQH